MIYIGIDVGPANFDAVIIDGVPRSFEFEPVAHQHLPSLDTLYTWIDSLEYNHFFVGIERTYPTGKKLGVSMWQTIENSARAYQMLDDAETSVVVAEPYDVYFVGRRRKWGRSPDSAEFPSVASYLTGVNNASQTKINAAVLARFEQTGGGKYPAYGTKQQPGPLYYWPRSNHARDAFGVAFTMQHVL
jgi:hypothetical protein